MSRRFDNKKLVLILSGLLIVLVLTVIFKIPKEKSTLKGNLVDFDTAEVAKIIITPKAATGKPFEFIRENEKWSVRQGNIISSPTKGAVGNIFQEVLSIKPQSLAAVGKSKLEEYELTDTLATRVRFLNKKDKELADIMIGKFIYRQVENPYASYGGNNIEGTTFVRLSGEEEIYAIGGFLSFSFGGEFNDWRDRSFLNCKKEDITRITFTMPADSSFSLEIKDSLWFAGNKPADSLKTSNYLSSISYLNGQDFKDEFKPVTYHEYQMAIEGNNLLNITIKCFMGEGGNEYILNSSLNPDVYFTSKRDGLFGQLFKSPGYFM